MLFISAAFALQGKHAQLCGFHFTSHFTAPQLCTNAFKCCRGAQLKKKKNDLIIKMDLPWNLIVPTLTVALSNCFLDLLPELKLGC